MFFSTYFLCPMLLLNSMWIMTWAMILLVYMLMVQPVVSLLPSIGGVLGVTVGMCLGFMLLLLMFFGSSQPTGCYIFCLLFLGGLIWLVSSAFCCCILLIRFIWIRLATLSYWLACMILGCGVISGWAYLEWVLGFMKVGLSGLSMFLMSFFAISFWAREVLIPILSLLGTSFFAWPSFIQLIYTFVIISLVAGGVGFWFATSYLCSWIVGWSSFWIFGESLCFIIIFFSFFFGFLSIVSVACY